MNKHQGNFFLASPLKPGIEKKSDDVYEELPKKTFHILSFLSRQLEDDDTLDDLVNEYREQHETIHGCLLQRRNLTKAATPKGGFLCDRFQVSLDELMLCLNCEHRIWDIPLVEFICGIYTSHIAIDFFKTLMKQLRGGLSNIKIYGGELHNAKSMFEIIYRRISQQVREFETFSKQIEKHLNGILYPERVVLEKRNYRKLDLPRRRLLRFVQYVYPFMNLYCIQFIDPHKIFERGIMSANEFMGFARNLVKASENKILVLILSHTEQSMNTVNKSEILLSITVPPITQREFVLAATRKIIEYMQKTPTAVKIALDARSRLENDSEEDEDEFASKDGFSEDKIIQQDGNSHPSRLEQKRNQNLKEITSERFIQAFVNVFWQVHSRNVPAKSRVGMIDACRNQYLSCGGDVQLFNIAVKKENEKNRKLRESFSIIQDLRRTEKLVLVSCFFSSFYTSPDVFTQRRRGVKTHISDVKQAFKISKMVAFFGYFANHQSNSVSMKRSLICDEFNSVLKNGWVEKLVPSKKYKYQRLKKNLNARFVISFGNIVAKKIMISLRIRPEEYRVFNK